MVDKDSAVAIECKRHCSDDDVPKHLYRLSRFKECFSNMPNFGSMGRWLP